MKKWICILINKITFGKVCLDWCKTDEPKTKKPTTKVAKTAVKPLTSASKIKPSKSKKTLITSDMKKQFIKDRKNGMTYKAIGKKYNVAASSVSYHIKKSK
jgi:Mor family transcriptional regulator